MVMQKELKATLLLIGGTVFNGNHKFFVDGEWLNKE